eukprot:2331760-Pyramimonas_sp.AAC.1
MGLHPSQAPTRRNQNERSASLPGPPAHGGSQGGRGRAGNHPRATARRQTRGLHGHHHSDGRP